ncbi:MAG: 3-phosphoshikimate 1-carboxyvinyltransferase [Chloroflexota bacterium]|nr:3-phosphoshikimate 1-carboxyvinyltransferase [Chloroflexota bacterium]
MAVDCFIVHPGDKLHGKTHIPGDKSISHRTVFFGALALGRTHVRGWLPAGDTEASLRAIQTLGVPVTRVSDTELIIDGGTMRAPSDTLDLVNAGTGIRLLTGIMVGQPYPSILDGSSQLRRRPMNRIITPLKQMGADINSLNGYAPLSVRPAQLRGITYHMPMASGQVKSAILLAGLFADGETVVIQPGPARDHTERMLMALGADIKVDGDTVTVTPGATFKPLDFTVPGDISSAAFPLVAALIVPGSDITLEHINLNPTRTGILDVLREMGADIKVKETGLAAGEPVGTIHVKHSALKGVRVGGEVVVRMIDEFPIFMVAALFADGETIVRDAGELRVKETDRIAVMVKELSKLGASITETEDGFYLLGGQKLMGATADGHDDHRISMSMVVAGLGAKGATTVLDAKCAGDSFPGYAATMQSLGADIVVKDITE